MNLNVESLRLSLHQGETVKLRGAAGAEVICRLGRLWITEEGNRNDVWLARHESFVCKHRGLTLLGAERDSEVEVRRPTAG